MLLFTCLASIWQSVPFTAQVVKRSRRKATPPTWLWTSHYVTDVVLTSPYPQIISGVVPLPTPLPWCQVYIPPSLAHVPAASLLPPPAHAPTAAAGASLPAAPSARSAATHAPRWPLSLLQRLQHLQRLRPSRRLLVSPGLPPRLRPSPVAVHERLAMSGNGVAEGPRRQHPAAPGLSSRRSAGTAPPGSRASPGPARPPPPPGPAGTRPGPAAFLRPVGWHGDEADRRLAATLAHSRSRLFLLRFSGYNDDEA
jgi:hypothetical protein